LQYRRRRDAIERADIGRQRSSLDLAQATDRLENLAQAARTSHRLTASVHCAQFNHLGPLEQAFDDWLSHCPLQQCLR
jgi:hypothetical protein